MSLFDECPLDAALTTIPKQVCAENLGQVVKLAFWMKGASPFTTTTIAQSAAWALAVADTDSGKAVVTNYITNLVIPQSAKVEQSADTNINAMPELQRGGNVNVSGSSRSISGAVRKALKKLTPYSQIQPGVTELVCVMINSDNQVIYNADSTTDLGFDVFNFFVSDTDIKAQLGSLNETMFDFYLKYAWSDGLAIKQAAFDLLNTYPAA